MWFGMRLGFAPMTDIVTGQEDLPSRNHFSTLGRSYVIPEGNVTGSSIMHREIGHMNNGGIPLFSDILNDGILFLFSLWESVW